MKGAIIYGNHLFSMRGLFSPRPCSLARGTATHWQVYGRMRKRYLKEHRPVIYSNLMLSGKLNQHLAEIDQACMGRIELITQQMKIQEGVTEALKAANQVAWIGHMNSIHSRAEEIVLNELVYA